MVVGEHGALPTKGLQRRQWLGEALAVRPLAARPLPMVLTPFPLQGLFNALSQGILTSRAWSVALLVHDVHHEVITPPV